MQELTPGAARRVALAAQGFADPAPAGRVDRRHLRRVLDRMGIVQIDSVNVVARSQYLPLFARLGGYRPALLDEAVHRHRDLYECWLHEATLAPVGLHPVLAWKRAEWEARGMRGWAAAHTDLVEVVLGEVAERGPTRASELSLPGERRGPWWGWSDGKRALEWLFAIGSLAVTRRQGFERVYDLTERVLPEAVLRAPVPPEHEARRLLLRLAARSLGVGTAEDLADYHRQMLSAVRPRLDELVEEGALERVTVRGWDRPAYLDPAARRPRRLRAVALLSPFDPVVWCRPRAERLFGFHYRIEIYTPPERRRFGYYVLPVLVGDRLVGRLDVKADRAGGVLRVPAAWAEAGVDPAEVAGPVAGELRAMAAWLGLHDVAVAPRGELAPALAGALATG